MLGFVINLLQTTPIIMFVFLYTTLLLWIKRFYCCTFIQTNTIHKHILQFSDTNQFDEIVLVE